MAIPLLENLTPFPALAFASRDVQNNSFVTAVMRITYDIQDDGRLEFAATPTPLVMSDRYFGEINRSSVREESDLAPFKPRCDLIVVGDAQAPEGRPATEWKVGLRFAEHRKLLRVTGPREWRNGRLSGWALSDPEPVTKVPLRYEYAWGGENRIEDEKGLAEAARRRAAGEEASDPKPLYLAACQSNPVGRGFATPEYLDRAEPRGLAAAQIEDPEQPVRRFGEALPAQGLGVIGRAWLPRRSLTGTTDEKWKNERWPGLPEDFDFGYWNGAHPDLQIPYPRGDEEFVLLGMTPEGRTAGRLPGHKPHLLLRFEAGELVPWPMFLDTVVFDAEARQVVNVWRGWVPMSLPAIRVMEARVLQKK